MVAPKTDLNPKLYKSNAREASNVGAGYDCSSWYVAFVIGCSWLEWEDFQFRNGRLIHKAASFSLEECHDAIAEGGVIVTLNMHVNGDSLFKKARLN